MALISTATARFSTATYRSRLRRAAAEARSRDLDALLITPSPDYAYLLGYRPPELERLTCLVVPAHGAPALILPRLEEPLARGQMDDLADELDVITWDETDDPFSLVRARLPGALRVGLQDQMWARFALRLGAQLAPAEMVEAGQAMGHLRRTKDSAEIGRLRVVAGAADTAMRAISAERLSGRSEAEVSRHVNELLLAAGHDTADFAIVASGPNSASPHHAPGERLIQSGDAIVLDIGGTRDGYCSDTTRTAFVGEPPAEFAALFTVLQLAQAAACAAVAPGVPARDIDRAARGMIDEAGYGELFFHRTGHGIGMETHEEPYIVDSNDELLSPGDAFSVEPGIYLAGQWGARIEDIVICTDAGAERLNTNPTDLLIVE